MALDFVGCWAIEQICKALFAELEPKPMITKGRERREKRRQIEENNAANAAVNGKKVE
jgi:cation-transporting ATPase 13A1